MQVVCTYHSTLCEGLVHPHVSVCVGEVVSWKQPSMGLRVTVLISVGVASRYLHVDSRDYA